MIPSTRMADPPVALTIGGHSYRVHSDANPDTLQHLAQLLDTRIATCNSHGRLSDTQALVYAALTLAADLEQERRARATLEERTRTSLQALLHRVDAALTTTDALLADAPPHR
jgi:cell division protein ZapA (FtsZ GTPase activity inhibitor)